MYVIYDAATEKTHSVKTLFFLCCLWWSKRKNFFCYNIIFGILSIMPARQKNLFSYNIICCMLSIMEQEKKLILLEHYFLYLVSDATGEKTHSVITLFFVCCLWWSKWKNLFCYNIIFGMLSMMDEEKKLILLSHYFLYVVYDGARKKNSFCYNVTFCFFSVMEQEEKLIVW